MNNELLDQVSEPQLFQYTLEELGALVVLIKYESCKFSEPLAGSLVDKYLIKPNLEKDNEWLLAPQGKRILEFLMKHEDQTQEA